MASYWKGLDAEAYDRQYDDRQLVRRIEGYLKKQKRAFIWVVMAVVALSLLNALPALLIGRAVSGLENEQNEGLSWLVVAIFGVGVAIWLFNWVYRANAAQIVEGMVVAMRGDAFAAVARQDLSFFDQYRSGRIVSRITSDTGEFGRTMILALDLIQQLATALILLITLFRIEWHMAMILPLIAPFILLIATFFRNLARTTTQQSSRVLGELNSSIQEAVTGIAVAKNFRQEQAIYQQFLNINNQAYKINLRRGAVTASVFPTLAFLLGIATGLLVYFGGKATIDQLIDLGAWYLFIATLDRFWFPLINLSSFWSELQQGLSSAERVFALIDSEASVIQTDHQPVPPLQGEIEFRGVNFGYQKNRPILHDFDLKIEAGETVALVGHTGAGKSSIIKIITRFYEFQEGEILIDGHDLRSFDLISYRSQLGIVSQIPFLFNGTVAENIRYGCPTATDAEIMAVAHKIGEGDWLGTLPNGLQTDVGERGSRLSMGQKQLVALTRVLVSNPSIFILDEATANIDPFTESQIQEALRLVMHGRSSIVIAHRLSTVKSADRIIVIDDGRIIEQGSHDQLLEQKGKYAELYDTYFRHQSLAYIDQQGWRNRD